MYLLLAVIVAVIGYLVSDGSIGDIPFAKLTLNKVLRALFAGCCYGIAALFSMKSWERDSVWPWRWSTLKRAKAWLRRRRSAKDIKQKIKRRHSLGYETEELQKELNQILQPASFGHRRE